MKRVLIFLLVTSLSFTEIYSQKGNKDSLAFQFFIEGYASSIPNQPYNKTRPSFFYNYTKANNAGINLALARFHYTNNRFRTNFGLMAGDYPKANLAKEAKWAQNIYEANVGFKLTKDYNVWLDAGVMPSHIGIESAIGKDNLVATRSIVADNTPYYETGLRLSYKPNAHWYLAMLTLTGWQRITVAANQLGTHWGMQITYTPSSKFSFNSSSYIGQIYYGRNLTRIYSNLSSTVSVSEKAAFTFGWDIGLQENIADANRTDIWNGLLVFFRYELKPGKWSTTLRYERFIDKRNVFLSLPLAANKRFNVNHASVNLDWKPVNNLLLRAEANYLQSPYPLFFKGDQLVANQFSAFFIASYNLQFSKKRLEAN